MNYLIVLEYCGTDYNGWQIQRNTKAVNNKTIENEIIKAIAIITKFNAKIFVSGRTDAGVHALNQVANFNLPFYYDLNKFKIALNGLLPASISIKSIELVHDSFHATRDSVSKTYLYKINSGFKSPLLSGRSWYVKEELNLNAMIESSSIFLGRNNFFNFVKREKEKLLINHFRVVTDIKIYRRNYGFDIFVEGEGFLRHMVRRMVGGIISCGIGKININCLSDMLKTDIYNAKPAHNVLCAPPDGLFLYSVGYKHKIYC